MTAHNRIQRKSQERSFLSALASVTILAFVVCLILQNHVGPPPSSFGIHKYLLDWVQSGHDLNLKGQREAHFLGILLCASFILGFSAIKKWCLRLSIPKAALHLQSVLLFCFSAASGFYWFEQPVSRPAWLAASTLFVLTVFRNKLPINAKTLLIFPLILTALSVLPGIIAPYDASWMSAKAMVEFQEGYSVVTAQGDQIAQGQRLFEDVKPHYGILLPVLCSVYERIAGVISFGQNIQIVRFLQMLSVFGIFVVYQWYARKKLLPILIAMMLILPWMHTNQISILFPNLSSWRNLSFIVSALGLLFVQRLPKHKKALALGALSGLCMGLNQEIGVATTSGLLAFLYFENQTSHHIFPHEFCKCIPSFFAGITGAIFSMYGFLTLCLGYMPSIQAYVDYLQYARFVASSGYAGGFPIEYNPFAILIFSHYCYALLNAALSIKPLPSRISFRAYAATTGLVWFAYYFNRPHEWYLQPQFFLYGFFVIDVVRAAQSKLGQNLEQRVICSAIILLCVVPQEILACEKAWPSYQKMLRVIRKKRAQHNAQLVDGLYIDAISARELREKANFVARESKENKLVFLTGSTMFIPKLSRCDSSLALADPFQELLTEQLTDDFISSIKKSDTTEILIDSDDCYLIGDDSRKRCWESIEQKLSPDFVFKESKLGWRILRRQLRSQSIP